jgi:hypothetical protein
MATYSMVIAVSVPKLVLAARGMVGESDKTDTKLSRLGIHGQGGKLNIAAELITNEELTETLTLVGVTELCSTSHHQGRDTIERLNI